MLKLALLVYSRGLVTSRKIEPACTHKLLFIALSGDSQPNPSRGSGWVMGDS